MVVALLLYARCKGQRSSRGIEQACVDDVAFRVIAANQKPDHATIPRFRQRHEDALAGLFGQVLGLWRGRGMVSVGVIAVDGTKLHASASRDANLDYEQVLEEAAEIDELENERYGDARGDVRRVETSLRRTRASGHVAGQLRPWRQALAGRNVAAHVAWLLHRPCVAQEGAKPHKPARLIHEQRVGVSAGHHDDGDARRR